MPVGRGLAARAAVIGAVCVGAGACQPALDSPRAISGSSDSGGSYGGDPMMGEGSSSGGEGADAMGTGTGSGGPAAPPPGIPAPTAPCPPLSAGVVSLCPAALGGGCREVLVFEAEPMTGEGPLVQYWHGTNETPEGLLGNDAAVEALLAMIEQEGGLMVVPYADPAAVDRPGVPFPWWVVCGSLGTECEREDDFALADEIVACAVQQGRVDHRRLTVAGMSAGGIMAAHLVGRVGYLAGAVSFSGGIPQEHRPVVPPGDAAVMAVHGGEDDVYCGPGVESCYPFAPAVEALVADVAAAGNFAFVCDHQAGHVTGLGVPAAGFLALASTQGHPWAGQSFGGAEHAVLELYCYGPGESSPAG